MLSLGGFFRRHQEDTSSGRESGSLHRKQQQLQVGPLAPSVAGSFSPSSSTPSHKNSPPKSPSPGTGPGPTASPFKLSAAAVRNAQVLQQSSSVSSTASTSVPKDAACSSYTSPTAAGTANQKLDFAQIVPEAAASSARTRAATTGKPAKPKSSALKVRFCQKVGTSSETAPTGPTKGTTSTSTSKTGSAAAIGTSGRTTSGTSGSSNGGGASLAAPEVALNVRRSSVVGLGNSICKPKVVHQKAKVRRARKKSSTAAAPSSLQLQLQPPVTFDAGDDSNHSTPSPPDSPTGRCEAPATSFTAASSSTATTGAMARVENGLSITAPEIVISPEPVACDSATCENAIGYSFSNMKITTQ